MDIIISETQFERVIDGQLVERNLRLFHGSNSEKIFGKFRDDQFFTTNDYIASNYAYNFGGFMYEVMVDRLKPFELMGYDRRRESGKHNDMVNLLRGLYGDGVANAYVERYFFPSPSVTFGEQGWGPIIEWSISNGYDSLKFIDESFDTFIRDISYLIFDGGKVDIIGVYDVEDAVNSNFAKEFVKVG